MDRDSPAPPVAIALSGNVLPGALADFIWITPSQLRELRYGEDEFAGAEGGVHQIEQFLVGHRPHHIQKRRGRWCRPFRRQMMVRRLMGGFLSVETKNGPRLWLQHSGGLCRDSLILRGYWPQEGGEQE
ncbi:MAG: hypothetical protein DI609_12600 [Corynebacterium urealyticum]|uniref:Uncharacterized protein n=1 Tax=Corynebacterium urealyticum TaxID=43771 RepID=A0A2W5AX62_9CORY|nr:MAG: hypothetical protein DI609_12600 [Corynebacterium urealyticum]